MNNKNDMNRINNNINKRLPVMLSFDFFLYKKYIKPNNNNIDISRLNLMFNYLGSLKINEANIANKAPKANPPIKHPGANGFKF